jgi:hypothetical protein
VRIRKRAAEINQFDGGGSAISHSPMRHRPAGRVVARDQGDGSESPAGWKTNSDHPDAAILRRLKFDGSGGVHRRWELVG